MTKSRFHSGRWALLTALSAGLACGEQALLECTGDAGFDRRTRRIENGPGLRLAGERYLGLLTFRFAAVAGWRVRRAALLLHRQSGAAATLRVGPLQAPWSEQAKQLRGVPPADGPAHPVREQEQGWMVVKVPADTVQQAVDGRTFGLLVSVGSGAIRLDARESIAFAPYLIVEGEPIP